jgi:uncharacterized membrane protein HdeD (DUF308 family)
VHTSNTILFMFLGAAILTLVAQIANYFSIDHSQRNSGRKIALASGIVAVVLTVVSGYMAAVDWAALPESPAGLRRGQLWNDEGNPAIVR